MITVCCKLNQLTSTQTVKTTVTLAPLTTEGVPHLLPLPSDTVQNKTQIQVSLIDATDYLPSAHFYYAFC